MLTYAFENLRFKEYEDVATEEFDNIYNLFSKILITALGKQIKQGLYRDYVEVDETTSSIRGKINITESINEFSFINKKLNCTYDEFSVNSYLNKIIKTTLNILLKAPINDKNRAGIKNILLYFRDVGTLDTKRINWQIRYDRNNQDYRLIIGICQLTIKGLLLSDKKGDMKLMKFFDDEQMARLYEKFILNFYDQECPRIKAHSPQVKWQLEGGFDDLLPKMQTDITLEYKNKILIIDAKYYSNITQTNFDKETIRNNNLYQIFTYVKNKAVEVSNYPCAVSGMLLYAKTDEGLQPDSSYYMSGNKISVRTLNLNDNFDKIKDDLITIVEKWLSENK